MLPLTSPAPSAMKAELFLLHARAEESHWWFRGRRRIVAELVHELAPAGSGAIVLDVGCGTGANLGALAADYRCIGIDPSGDAVALARARFPGTTFIVGNAPDDLPQEAREAAVVLLMDVLEHVADDAGLLAKLVSFVRPGTRFIITVPAEPALWSPHDVTLGHYRRYEQHALRATWSSLPVTVELLSPFNARLYPPIRLIRKITRRRGRALGELGTDVRMPPRLLNAALERVFAGEAPRLVARLLEKGGGAAYPVGVSLLAVLARRES